MKKNWSHFSTVNTHILDTKKLIIKDFLKVKSQTGAPEKKLVTLLSTMFTMHSTTKKSSRS